jgi:hypothetical protein
LDAVLVTRKDDPPDPTDLYLVPHGESVPREPPIPLYPTKENLTKKVRALTPFHGYGVKEAQVRWRDRSTLLLSILEGDVRQRKDSHEVKVASGTRSIKIEYFIGYRSIPSE